MDREALKLELKKMVIYECDAGDEVTADEITDDEVLFGSDAPLALDSLDALQLSLAVESAYGVKIQGASDGRKAFGSINILADYILERQTDD